MPACRACPGQPGPARSYRGSARRSRCGLGAHAQDLPGPGVVLGLRVWAALEHAVKGGTGVAPVIFATEQVSDVPGDGFDPALGLGPAQLLDQVPGQADRQLLRCGHTTVIPVPAACSQPERQQAPVTGPRPSRLACTLRARVLNKSLALSL